MIRKILSHFLVAATVYVFTMLYCRHKFLARQDALVADYRELQAEHSKLLKEAQELRAETRRTWDQIRLAYSR